MNIRISDLPLEGLKIKESIPLEALNKRLQEGHEIDIEFTTEPTLEITCFRRTEGAEIQGFVNAKYKQPCGRCTDRIERELKVDANYILKPKPAEMTEQDTDFTDDIGIVYYSGDHVDLESLIQESLIISLSIYWSAPVDKSGKCSICGIKDGGRKESTEGKANFGELLKKAGLK